MTLDETRYLIYSFTGGLYFDNRTFLEFFTDQEARREQAVKESQPGDLDHAFFLLFEEDKYGADVTLKYEDRWTIEIVTWIELWMDIHPQVVKDKMMQLANRPELWKPLVYMVGDCQRWEWLSCIEKIISEAVASQRIDQELIDLIKQSLDSVLEWVASESYPHSKVEGIVDQIAQLKQRLPQDDAS